MKKILRPLFLVSKLLLAATSGVLAQPGNDDCGNGIFLVPGTSCSPTTGTLLNARGGGQVNACIGVDRPDVWYRFVATTTNVEIRVTGNTNVDLVVSAFNGCGGAIPNGGACTDQTGNGGVETLNLTGLTLTHTYFIRVQDYYGNIASAATFTICVVSLGPPNDVCTNAATLTPRTTCTATLGTLFEATVGGPSNSCVGAGVPDVWYRFVATTTRVQIRVEGSTNVDLVVSAFNDCGGTTPSGGACTDQSGDGGVEILNLTGLTLTKTYFIRVQDYYGNIASAATFTICVVSMGPPNDVCTNAATLTPQTTCTATLGTLFEATVGGPSNSCTGAGVPDVWYQFVATTTRVQIRVEGSTDVDLVVSAFNDCGGTTPSGGACTDQSGDGGVEILNLTGLTLTKTYLIRVQDFYGNIASAATFTICVVSMSPPNDICTNAATLTPQTTCTATLGTLFEATVGGPSNSCVGAGVPDVWYKFVAASSQQQVQVTGNPDLDLVISAFNSCGGSVSAGGGCADNSGDGGPENLYLSSLTVGNTYYVRVQDFYGFIGPTATFNICVITAQSLPLQLLSFTGKARASDNLLLWETTMEQHVRFHAVERAADGRIWQEIGRKDAATPTTANTAYTLIDALPLAQAWYRLRSVDVDGTAHYSPLVQLDRRQQVVGNLQVFPSPATERLTLRFVAAQETGTTIRILAMDGRTVWQRHQPTVAGTNETNIAIGNLAPGTYMVKVETPGKTLWWGRFAKP